MKRTDIMKEWPSVALALINFYDAILDDLAIRLDTSNPNTEIRSRKLFNHHLDRVIEAIKIDAKLTRPWK